MWRRVAPHVYVVRFSQTFGPFFLERVLAPVSSQAALRRFSFFLRSNVKRSIFSLRLGIAHWRPWYMSSRVDFSSDSYLWSINSNASANLEYCLRGHLRTNVPALSALESSSLAVVCCLWGCVLCDDVVRSSL